MTITDMFRWFHSSEADEALSNYNCVFSNWWYHYQWLVDNHNDMRNQLECCLPKCRWCVLDQRVERRISLFQTHWKRFIRHRYQIIQARETSGRWIRVGDCQ